MSVRFKQTGNYYNSKERRNGLAQVSNDGDSKKPSPLTVPMIIEQLERALIDIKYNQSDDTDELVFNKNENVPIESKIHPRPQFIGKELMLFEMIGILNGKISELQKKYQKIKSIEEREEQFFSSKADQITQPVQDILDYVKLAKSLQMEPGEALDQVMDVAKKLQNVTTIVLDSNRIANDSLKLSKQKQNVNEIITQVIKNSKPKLNVPILAGLDNDIEIQIDQIRLSQVLETVINNSIKFTETGQIKVESFVAHEQNLFIIRINDTGTGISKEILSKIFEKDLTENHIKNRNDTKLSLYLCKGIIEAHAGKISVKNNKELGCTFSITLPIKKK